MLKINAYSSKGIKKDSISLPKDFEIKANNYGIAQAVRVYEDRSHRGMRKVKTRSEVSTSTRKIYRQKGTGGARHGAKSAPIFAGGGVAHGPKGIKRVLKLSKSIRKSALYSALSAKVGASQVVLVEGLNNISKTKDAQVLIDKIVGNLTEISKKGNILLALSEENGKVNLAFRNIKRVSVTPFKALNALNVVNYQLLILDSQILEKKADGDKKSSEKNTKKKTKEVKEDKGVRKTIKK